MTVTKELSATEILLTSQTLLTDGLTIENSLSNGLDLTLFNKLDDPEAMNKILSAAANDKGNYLLMFFDYNTLNLSHRIKNHASWKMQNGTWSF